MTYQKALVLRANGKLVEALNILENYILNQKKSLYTPGILAIRGLAAELARSLIQMEYARNLLSEPLQLDKDLQESLQLREGIEKEEHLSIVLPFFYLNVELSLESNAEIAAANALNVATRMTPTPSPWLMALQARLSWRQNDFGTAKQSLYSAVEIIQQEQIRKPDEQMGGKSIQETALRDQLPNRMIGSMLAVALAAIELHEWDIALHFTRLLISHAPSEPYPYILIAKTIILRAEYQRFCEAVGVSTHSPGTSALSEEAYHSFLEAIKKARDYLNQQYKGIRLEQPQITYWEYRGNVVFRPNEYNLQKLQSVIKEPEDYALRIATHRILGKLPQSLTQDDKEFIEKDYLTENPFILAQMSLYLGEIGRRQDDLIQAIQLAKKAIQKQSNQPLYHALLAKLAHRLGDDNLALESIITALSIWPEEPEWHRIAANIYLQRQEVSPAIEHLEKAVQLSPDDYAYHQALGYAYFLNRDFIKAIKELEYSKQLSPDNLETYKYLAEAYLKVKNVNQAIEMSEMITKLAPEDATSQILKGKIALEEKDFKKAKQFAAKALQIDSSNIEAYQLLAKSLRGLGQLIDAIKVLDRLISLVDQPLPFLLEKVDIIQTCQGKNAAKVELERLNEQFPNNANIISALAEIQASEGNCELAIKYAHQAIKLGNGTLTSDEKANLHYLLGKSFHQCGQLDLAIFQLNEAIQLNPLHLDTYLLLGQAQKEQRLNQSALQTYHKAIQAIPNDPRPYYQASLLLKEMHDYQAAEEMLRRACDLDPNNLTLRRQLGALVAHNLIHNRQSSSKIE